MTYFIKLCWCTWCGDVAGRIAVSQLQGPWFDPKLVLLSLWTICACLFDFFPPLKTTPVGVLSKINYPSVWVSVWIMPSIPRIGSESTVTLPRIKWLKKVSVWVWYNGTPSLRTAVTHVQTTNRINFNIA